MFTSAAVGLTIANISAETLKLKIVLKEFYLGHFFLFPGELSR